MQASREHEQEGHSSGWEQKGGRSQGCLEHEGPLPSPAGLRYRLAMLESCNPPMFVSHCFPGSYNLQLNRISNWCTWGQGVLKTPLWEKMSETPLAETKHVGPCMGEVPR